MKRATCAPSVVDGNTEIYSISLSSSHGLIEDSNIIAMSEIITFAVLNVYETPFAAGKGSFFPEYKVLYERIPGLCHAVSVWTWYPIMDTFSTKGDAQVFENWHSETVTYSIAVLVICWLIIYKGKVSRSSYTCCNLGGQD
jgi:hypothetical protein